MAIERLVRRTMPIGRRPGTLSLPKRYLKCHLKPPEVAGVGLAPSTPKE